MKKSIQFCLVFIISTLLFPDCKKTEIVYGTSEKDLINTAKDFFTQALMQQSITVNSVNQTERNPRKRNPKTPLWDKATVVQLSIGNVVLVPIEYINPFYVSNNLSEDKLYNINQIVRLLIYRDKQQHFRAELLTFFPDSSYKTGSDFTGIIFVDDWSCNPITKYKIEKNKRILKWNANSIALSEVTVATNELHPNLVRIVQTCYVIDGYNYSAADPNGAYYWSEPAGCSVNFMDESGSGGGGGGMGGSNYLKTGVGGISPAGTVMVNPGVNIIGNIKDYDKCFTNTAGNDHTYTVTVCVDQPVPGLREAWGFAAGGPAGSTSGGNPFNVGHVFLIFNEATSNNVVTRNVGFYPANSVSPRTPAASGQLNNDALHGYNISLTISTTNSQFFNMLNYVEQGNVLQYNLNSNNCSSFALHTLYAGGIYLPSTIGTWPGGSGNDPGDLGEDIRSMTLQSNMIRNTVSNYHPNLGNCN